MQLLAAAPGPQQTGDVAGAVPPTLGKRGGSKDAMSELLHWAVEHSDPERLKEIMQKYQDQNLTIKDVYGQDVIDALFVDEAGVMERAIEQLSDFRNSSKTDEELETALNQLHEMVEQVDNAGNLHRMGGLSPLLELAVGNDRGSELKALALWTLGVAVQNNAPVQDDLSSLGGLDKLVAKLPSCNKQDNQEGPFYCGKLVFAISGFIRNNVTIQDQADRLGLFDWLLDHGVWQNSTAVVKKVLGLLDTVLAQSPELRFLEGLPARQDQIATALVALAEGRLANGLGVGSPADWDITEKSLRLVNRLISLRPLLFGEAVRPALLAATSRVSKACESDDGTDNEVCEGIAELSRSADLGLSAREIRDEEL